MQRRRPKDVVIHFLQRWLSENDREGVRLPSVRQIAEDTQTSASTVYTVFRQMAEEGKIHTKLGSGSFLSTQPGKDRPIRLALNVSGDSAFPSDNLWKAGICSGILAAAARQRPRMMILPSHTSETDADVLREEILAERDEVDALILFPSALNPILCASYLEAGKAVISLNAPDDCATSDFVSPDYLKASRRIGLAWKQSGRKRILYMSHIQPDDSSSSRQRMMGLFAPFGEALGDSIEYRVVVAGGAHEADGARVMRELLGSGRSLPDAIYCVGDFQAIGVLKVLQEAAIKVPETVSVIAGTGFEWTDPLTEGMTCTRQPLQQLGNKLVEMALDLMRTKRPVPGVYFEMKFIGGKTTTPFENQLLEVELS